MHVDFLLGCTVTSGYVIAAYIIILLDVNRYLGPVSHLGIDGAKGSVDKDLRNTFRGSGPRLLLKHALGSGKGFGPDIYRF